MTKIEDKIKKLLSLAGSANEHEANLALEKASELMREHGVSHEDVRDDPFAGEVRFEKLHFQTRETINAVLAHSIARAFGGRSVNFRGQACANIFGTESVRVTIRNMYEYSMQTIDRLAKEEMKKISVNRRKYRNRFRSGLAMAMSDTLDRITLENKRYEGNEYAMVLVSNEKKLDNAVNEVHPNWGRRSVGSSTYGGVGFQSGKEAGQGVGFSRQTQGAGQRLIGG